MTAEDEDLAVLQVEAQTGATPERRLWAKRLLERLERLERIAAAQQQLAITMTYGRPR